MNAVRQHMRLDGDKMIQLKDVVKLAGISIISFCAVFVCTLFLNYNMDLLKIEDQITMDIVGIFYDAQVMMGKVISAVSGLCLLLTSVVMLCFYIKHYIDVHKKELGILKALGYSGWKIAGKFWVFGLSVFLGALLGFGGAFALLPLFYKVQNEEKILPEIPVCFNPQLFLFLVIVPTVFFALLAILYSYFKLKCPALALLREKVEDTGKGKKQKKESARELSFLQELKKSTVRSRKSLIFFIWFASFCYSSMMQMSASMDELASVMFSVMIIMIGIVLACTTLFLAITTVVNANTKTISMMRVFGYSLKDCSNAILNGYRPVAYIGFAIGTIYQYGLLKMTLTVIFKDVQNVPEYNFDWTAFVIVLLSFLVIYEFIMYVYTARIKKISVKEIMME